MPVMVVAMATSLVALGATSATAEPAPAAAAAAQPVAPEPDTRSATEWRAVKRDLNASSLARTVEVAGGVKTMTYTLTTGGTMELREPVGPQADVTVQFSIGGCGFLQVCVYFTPTEQRMILGGYGYLLAAGICAAFPPGCVPAGLVIVVAGIYLNDQVCPGRLRMRILPTVGGGRCV